MNKFTLAIEFDPTTGQVTVNGDLSNRLLVYGLLTFAQEIILRQAMASESRIVSPVFVPPPGSLKQ